MYRQRKSKPLPEHAYVNANGWVVENLRRYGNSVLPDDAIKAFKHFFGDDWREMTEQILLRILQEQGEDVTIVDVYEATTERGLYIARCV